MAGDPLRGLLAQAEQLRACILVELSPGDALRDARLDRPIGTGFLTRSVLTTIVADRTLIAARTIIAAGPIITAGAILAPRAALPARGALAAGSVVAARPVLVPRPVIAAPTILVSLTLCTRARVTMLPRAIVTAIAVLPRAIVTTPPSVGARPLGPAVSAMRTSVVAPGAVTTGVLGALLRSGPRTAAIVAPRASAIARGLSGCAGTILWFSARRSLIRCGTGTGATALVTG
ncbi:MAG: hypothetical protein L0H39_08720 [Brachybacterium sp.]|nr:hypothetical protein [Brachybacterium sp.]